MKALIAMGLAAAAFAAAPAQQRDAPAAQVQPQTGTARIYGRVLSAETGEPVRGATVYVSDPVAGTWVATTDDDGRFDVRALPAARFSIRVDKATFLRTAFSLFPPAVNGVELKAGQQLDRGDLRLPRGGAVAGRVVDERGDAVVDANVRAWRVEHPEPGMRRLANSGGSWSSNDIGEFRIYGLRPGKYYVSAGFDQWLVSVASPGRPATQIVASARGPLTTFYPGVVSADDGLPVMVTAGEGTAGIAIRLLSAVLSRVSGRVVDSHLRPAQNVVVMLNTARHDGAFFGLSAIGVDANGRFEFTNVPAGEYRVDVVSAAQLEATNKTGTVGRPPDGNVEEFASQPLTVTADVPDLIVQTSLGFDMSGRVLVDGVPPAAAFARSLQVDALPMLAGQPMSNSLQAVGGTVRPDGSFVVRGLIGSRQIRVSGLPAGAALKAVIARGADITDEGLEVGQDHIAGVEIQITTKPTDLSGVVTDATGAATRDYVIVIASDDSRRWTMWRTRYVVSASPRDDGSFRIAGLPAGRYFAVALTQVEERQWPDPENLERLRKIGTLFTLGDAESHTLTLVRR